MNWTPEEEAAAKMVLGYLAKSQPDRKWVIGSRDELLAAIAYVQSYHG